MSTRAGDLKDSPVAQAMDQRHAAWKADLPLGDDAALRVYLTGVDQERRLSLLAHCLSFGINALHETVNPYSAGISANGMIRRMAQEMLMQQSAWTVPEAAKVLGYSEGHVCR